MAIMHSVQMSRLQKQKLCYFGIYFSFHCPDKSNGTSTKLHCIKVLHYRNPITWSTLRINKKFTPSIHAVSMTLHAAHEPNFEAQRHFGNGRPEVPRIQKGNLEWVLVEISHNANLLPGHFARSWRGSRFNKTETFNSAPSVNDVYSNWVMTLKVEMLKAYQIDVSSIYDHSAQLFNDERTRKDALLLICTSN